MIGDSCLSFVLVGSRANCPILQMLVGTLSYTNQLRLANRLFGSLTSHLLRIRYKQLVEIEALLAKNPSWTAKRSTPVNSPGCYVPPILGCIALPNLTSSVTESRPISSCCWPVWASKMR